MAAVASPTQARRASGRAGRRSGAPLLAVARLVALDADPVDQVEQQHGGGCADEHRSGRQADPPRGPRDDHAGDEQQQRDPVADEIQRHLEPTVARIVMMPDLENAAVPKGARQVGVLDGKAAIVTGCSEASAGQRPSCSRSTEPAS